MKVYVYYKGELTSWSNDGPEELADWLKGAWYSSREAAERDGYSFVEVPQS